MDLNVIKQVLGYNLTIPFISILFFIIQVSSFAIGCSLVIVLLSLIKEIKLENFKQILVRAIFCLLISILVFVSIGYLRKMYDKKQDISFEKNITCKYEEIFIPLDTKSANTEDYTKELIIDKQIYNIKSYNEVKVNKISSEVQGIVLYKLNISSNTNKKDLNEKINNFNKNPIYILKEIRY